MTKEAASSTTSKICRAGSTVCNVEPIRPKSSELASGLGDESKTFIQTEKPFGTLSAISIGYGVTNTAVAIPLILSTTIPMGGLPQVFWGFLAMAVVGLATATTLAELTSAMPHPGGQYIWANNLAPEAYRRGLSYTTAMISWIAAIAIGASAILSVILNGFHIVQLFYPGLNYGRWMGFVAYQIINVITCLGACFEHALPKISNALLILNIMTVGAIITTLFVMSKIRTTAQEAFIQTVNVSGWPDGVAFIIGLNGLNWNFSCLEVATHIAEEIPSPAVNIPKALMWTILVATSSGLLMVLAIILNVGPIKDEYNGISIFLEITGNRSVTVSLWILILFLILGSCWGIQTWQSRLAWTISRESGFPFHRHFGRIFPSPFHTPLWSLVGSAIVTAIFGFLYLASELAFNSLIATGILLQYLSYSIPTLLVIWNGRSRFKHGTFWYPKLGLIANLIMLGWTVVAFIFYCFPAYSTVEASQMNYVSVVFVIIAIFIASLWFLFAKSHFEVTEDLNASDSQ